MLVVVVVVTNVYLRDVVRGSIIHNFVVRSSISAKSVTFDRQHTKPRLRSLSARGSCWNRSYHRRSSQLI